MMSLHLKAQQRCSRYFVAQKCNNRDLCLDAWRQCFSFLLYCAQPVLLVPHTAEMLVSTQCSDSDGVWLSMHLFVLLSYLHVA